jgi:hypothetical protein
MKYPSDCDVIHWKLLGPRGLPHFSELNSKSFWWSPIDHTSLGINCVIIHLLGASACFWMQICWAALVHLIARHLREPQGAFDWRQGFNANVKEPDSQDERRSLQESLAWNRDYFHGVLPWTTSVWNPSMSRRVLTSRTSNADRWGVWKEIESTSADLHNCLTFQQTIRVVKISVSKNSILG